LSSFLLAVAAQNISTYIGTKQVESCGGCKNNERFINMEIFFFVFVSGVLVVADEKQKTTQNN
jgi:hypothetical protein